MADAGAVEGGAADLVWPETGEKVSKNEYKRRLKQQEKEKAAAEKAAARAGSEAAVVKPKVEKAEEVEEEMDARQYFELRTKMIAGWQEKGVSAYPHKFQTSMEIPEYVTQYKSECLPAGMRLAACTSPPPSLLTSLSRPRCSA